MLSIGIDPGVQKTGIVCFLEKKLICSRTVVTKSKGKKTIFFDYNRCVFISNNVFFVLNKIFKKYFSYPTNVFLEGPSFGRNPNRTIQTGMLHQAILHALAFAFYGFDECFVYYVPPKTLKKCITGNGNASKEQVSKVLMRDFGAPKYDCFDLFDAYGLACLDRFKDSILDKITECDVLCRESFHKRIGLR